MFIRLIATAMVQAEIWRMGPLTWIPMMSRRPVRSYERYECEWDAEGENDLAEDEDVGGVQSDGEHGERGDHRYRAAQREGDLEVDEAGHHDLPGVGADARGRGSGGEQRDRERERGAAADEVSELEVGLLDRAQAR